MRENEFYVYAHRRADNGEVFYIGKGWGDRAKSKYRTSAWLEVFAEAGGFDVEIIASELGDEEARQLEAIEIERHWGKLVNKRRRDIKPITAPTRETIRFDVDAELIERLQQWRKAKPALAPFNRVLDACIREFLEQQTGGLSS